MIIKQYSLIYKNYQFEFKNGFNDGILSSMVWVGDEVYPVDYKILRKVEEYVKREINLNEISKKIEQDIRKHKLTKIKTNEKITTRTV